MNLRIVSIFKERPALYFNFILFFLRGQANPIHLWDDDKQFVELMRMISDYSLVDKKRCFMLYQFCKQVSSLKGDIAEVGVFKGGTARLLAESVKAQNKNIHLFDTFEGIPHSDPGRDIIKKGDFKNTSLESVKSYLGDLKNIFFYQGLFPASAKSLENLKFSLAHIDVDIYKSVVDCCAFFYPRIEKGGIMIFDDYGHLCCPGAKTAVDEFFSDKVEKPCYLPTGQCIVIRL